MVSSIEAINPPNPTRYNLHFDLILKLLDKKRNILVEKPAFLTIKQAEKVFNKKNFENIFFSEGYMYLYHPQIIELINNIKNYLFT